MIRNASVITSENRGSLLPMEVERDIPFDIKRVFFLYDMEKGAVRGNHANMNGQCAIVLLAGKAEVMLCDGIDTYTVVLDNPGQYLCIENAIWQKVINQQKDTVLCVFASNRYDEADYESDYAKYLSKKV